MTQIVINIPSELAIELRRTAAERRTVPSALVIEALGSYLQAPAPADLPVVASDPPSTDVVPTARRSKRPSARALPWRVVLALSVRGA